MAHLEMEEVGFDDWQLKMDVVMKTTIELDRRYRPSMSHFSDDGLTIIPTSCKDWASTVGIEHDERVKWFSIGMYKEHGELRRQSFGSGAYLSMVTAILWNAALYIHFTRKPVHTGAAEATAARFLRLSNIGGMNNDEETIRQRIAMAAKAAGAYVNVVLAMAMDNEGHIGGVGLEMIESNNREILFCRQGRCVNSRLRNLIADALVRDGIGQCATRDEQERMLCRYAVNDSRLKRGALRAIRRRLMLLPKYMDEGVSPILPYGLGGNAVNIERSRQADYRFAELLEGIEQGHIMNMTERRFVCTYLKKNPAMRKDLEEARRTYKLVTETEKCDILDGEYRTPCHSLKEYVMVGVSDTHSKSVTCPTQCTRSTPPSPIFPQAKRSDMVGCDTSVLNRAVEDTRESVHRDADRRFRTVMADVAEGKAMSACDRKFVSRMCADGKYAKMYADVKEARRRNRVERKAKCKVL